MLLLVATVWMAKAILVTDIKKDFPISQFSELTLNGPFRADIFQGEEEFVLVSSPDSKLIDNLVVEQDGEKLSLKLRDTALNTKNLKVKIGFKTIKKLVIA